MPTNRRKFLVQSGMAATALIAVKSSKAVSKFDSWFSAQEEKDNTVLLLHTNDIRNQLFADAGNTQYTGLGGFHKTSQCIAELKRKNSGVVLLDAGNTFSGTEQEKQEHDETLQLMGRLNYDATVPGHCDLAAGIEHFTTSLEKNNITAIATNYAINSGLRGTMPSYKIIKRGNIKIGIVGMARKSDANMSEGEYRGAVKEVSSVAAILKNEKGCNLVVCLSQLGYKNKSSVDDITFAKLSENIDVIVGGHSRRFMAQPSIILNRKKQEVVINHAGHSGMVVGSIQIVFNNKGEKKSVKFENYLVGADGWKKELYS